LINVTGSDTRTLRVPVSAFVGSTTTVTETAADRQ